jgi:hypothetical protein
MSEDKKCLPSCTIRAFVLSCLSCFRASGLSCPPAFCAFKSSSLPAFLSFTTSVLPFFRPFKAASSADVTLVCAATTSSEDSDRANLYVDQEAFVLEFLRRSPSLSVNVLTDRMFRTEMYSLTQYLFTGISLLTECFVLQHPYQFNRWCCSPPLVPS